MIIPVFIAKALEKRIEAAEQLKASDEFITMWMKEQGMDVDDDRICENVDGGLNCIIQPKESAEILKDYINRYVRKDI